MSEISETEPYKLVIEDKFSEMIFFKSNTLWEPRNPLKADMEKLDLNVTYFEEGEYVMVINTSKVKMYFRTTDSLELPGKYIEEYGKFRYFLSVGVMMLVMITVCL